LDILCLFRKTHHIIQKELGEGGQGLQENRGVWKSGEIIPGR